MRLLDISQDPIEFVKCPRLCFECKYKLGTISFYFCWKGGKSSVVWGEWGLVPFVLEGGMTESKRKFEIRASDSKVSLFGKYS